MSVALHGSLRDFGIGEVFQLIGQQRKSGVLAVQSRGGEVELRFDEGRIVSAAPVGTHERAALGEMLVRCGLLTRERLAELERERESSLLPLDELLVERVILPREQIDEIEDLLTRDTIFDLLRWTDGSFRFVPRPIQHGREPASLLGAEQVLMDGLRMVDEWTSISEEIPEPATVLRRTGRFEDYRLARGELDPRRLETEERVYLLVDGRLPARRIMDLSRLGTFEAARALVELQRAGLIETTAARQVVAGRARGPKRPAMRLLLVSGFAVAMLAAAVAGIAWQSHAPAGAPGVHRLPAHPLRWAREVFATQRLRNGAHAVQFGTGRWPALDELRPLGGALTPSEAGYYHRVSAGTPMLLAPES